MALSQSALTNAGSTTAGTSFGTASITPTANRLVIVEIATTHTTSANAAVPTGVSGNGITYALLASKASTAGGFTTSLWRGMSASPSAGAITINYANQVNRINWSVFEIDGVDISGSNGANAVNSNTATGENVTATVATVTATLAAFANANNGAIAACLWGMAGATQTCTPDTGWTEVSDAGVAIGGAALCLEAQFRASNDTTAQGTWAANGAVQTVAAEIVAAPILNPMRGLMAPRGFL